MNHALLIDFGSTFTKVTVADLAAEEILATAQAPTTIETDIMAGLEQALALAGRGLDFPVEDCGLKLACSSAAGGLKMVAVGLVPELTAEAAKMAALGAGAKVLGTFSYKLNTGELAEMGALGPEIVLLSGGTDGGESETILHNARMLAGSRLAAPVIVAGNKVVREEARAILEAGGKEAVVTDNVLPRLDQVNIEPAREAVREVFMRRIVAAKGLDRAESFVDQVVMPTPAAVLQAATLLAEGAREEAGLGDLLVVDPGGATTDVHSVTEGLSLRTDVQIKGLPEPRAKRTVEGDLGLRYSVQAMFEAAGGVRILQHLPHGHTFSYSQLERQVEALHARPRRLPETGREQALDLALARTAVDLAVERHAGVLKEFFGPMGTVLVQYGKDLSDVDTVIATGGALVNCPDPRGILEACLQTDPHCLKPRAPAFLLDHRYILSAMGLLATRRPLCALRILKKYLREV